MSFFVDTSVWSLAFRRDTPSSTPEVTRLCRALESRESLYCTGLVLQELLQGFRGAKAHEAIVERFASLAMVVPDREDHIGAAEIRNLCRRQGVQLGTVDALLAQLCIRHDLSMLSTDQDFVHAAHHVPLHVWRNGRS